MKGTDSVCSHCCVQPVPPSGRQTQPAGPWQGLYCHCCPGPAQGLPVALTQCHLHGLVALPGRAQAFLLQFDHRQLHSSLLCTFKIPDFLFLTSNTSISLFTQTVPCWWVPLIALTWEGKRYTVWLWSYPWTLATKTSKHSLCLLLSEQKQAFESTCILEGNPPRQTD